MYPKTRVIIDCTEIFVETPSSSEVQSLLWSEYNHHCTFKLLICITPNGTISWISPAYGGCGSDRFIVQDSGFLDLLEPDNCVMANQGFKIKDDLLMRWCTLAIPPNTSKIGLPLTELPLFDDYIWICAAFVNLKPPLSEWFLIEKEFFDSILTID